MSELKPKIKSIGVGGGGCNATAYMSHSEIEGVEFIAANTDAQDLEKLTKDIKKIQLGEKLTSGLGAGANPKIGRRSAEESEEEIRAAIEGANMLFISAGMGGGTGTGAAPIIAEIAQSMGILVVAVVTKPFHYEREKRMSQALDGIKALQEHTDSLIVIPNDQLKQIIPINTPMGEVFEKVDQVLYKAIQGIAEVVTVKGIINIDFNDLKTVMKNSGNSMIGLGIAEGEDKAKKAAEEAINSPLLEAKNLSRAKRAVVNVSLGIEGTLEDFEQVGEVVKSKTAEGAEVIMGYSVDEKLTNQVKVTIIATDFETEEDLLKLKEDNVVEIEDKIETTNVEENSNKLPNFIKRGSIKDDVKTNIAKEEVDLKDVEEKKCETPIEDQTPKKKIPQFLKKKIK
jgi:cell division protein FtsZ